MLKFRENEIRAACLEEVKGFEGEQELRAAVGELVRGTDEGKRMSQRLQRRPSLRSEGDRKT